MYSLSLRVVEVLRFPISKVIKCHKGQKKKTNHLKEAFLNIWKKMFVVEIEIGFNFVENERKLSGKRILRTRQKWEHIPVIIVKLNG